MTMSVSDQIIAVINDLCEKFGIVIDWSAETILPYVEALCKRFIQYEIYTSIAWCILVVGVTLITGAVWGISTPVYRRTRSDSAEAVCGISMIAFWICLAVCIIVCSFQAFDIIEATTIPEKTIIDYLKTILQSNQR